MEDGMLKQFPILRHFETSHLPEHLREVSGRFAELAYEMVNRVAHERNGAEVAAGLRKLLEAKDCFVRAAL